MYFNRAWVSARVLKAPVVENNRLHKGALVLNQINPIVQMFPILKSLFALIERRGWHGVNDGEAADIKLVEDSSTLEETRQQFPDAILLDIGPADFVDPVCFRPLPSTPDYDVIQISCWSKRKRIEMFIEAAARLPDLSFVHLGHFENNGNAEELAYRDHCIGYARKIGANITFAFGDADRNECLPTSKDDINRWINRAKIGVLTTTSEGINRFKMECIAADRPVIICNDVCVPTRKHVNERTGVLVDPNSTAVANGISALLQNRKRYHPRHYLVENTGNKRSLGLLKAALSEVCRRNDMLYHFDTIEWDGRNESLAWGEHAFDLLTAATRDHADLVEKTSRAYA